MFFLKIYKGYVIKDNTTNPKVIMQTVLCNRGFVSSASNHAKGFHSHLRTIESEGNWIAYNLDKLLCSIFRQYEIYIS